MSSDLVSVIMPAYNAEKYISEAIESVIQQTYTHWELIVVDDGSTDNTAAIIKNYTAKDSRIRYIQQPHQRQARARNNGLFHASGELIAFLDADDIWMPGKLEVQVDIMHRNSCDVTFSDAYFFETKPAAELQQRINVKYGKYEGEQATQDFLDDNRIPLLTAVARKSSLQKVDNFSELPGIHEDYDLWIRMLINGSSFLGIETPLAYYRVHPSSASYGEGKLLFMDIHTLENITVLYPQYKIQAERSIVKRIQEYLGNNNVSSWGLANELFGIRNKLAEKKMRILPWRWIYKISGKKIFRILFNLFSAKSN
ncbi:MAG TPA: glycosyltransferase [Chitinophagaceae bacterium]|nr:glycosyltransferase [Chitinophagaceae bacterium]